MITKQSLQYVCNLWACPFLLPADGESYMEEETRLASGFLHFDTASKGSKRLSNHIQIKYL